MKKIVLLVVLVIALALVLAACGQSTPAPTKAPVQVATTAPAEPTAAPTEAPAEPTAAPVAELDGDGARGGRLYDAWFEELGVDVPESDQALWSTQSSNTRSGEDSWRCKECHGWDYKGVDGAYGSGSHKTGFTGMWDAIGKGQDYVLGALKGETNPDHDFSSYMDEQDLVDLTVFLTTEAVDDSTFVGSDKMAVGGDVANGKELFDTCADCHGPEGLALNFGFDEGESEYLPTVAQDNPWEFLNKMRYGQPGVDRMPFALDIGWTEDEQLDVLAYAQTLPTSGPIAEGGRLYDAWWKPIGADAPTTDMPLWATQDSNTRSGADTWRCKECHGWDYKGADGAYGSGSHKTGFIGIWDAQSMSADEITAWMDGSNNADHDFSQYLNEEQIGQLVAFIQGGVIDKSTFINADKTIIGGDADHGKVLFSECAECHGDDGKLLNFGDEGSPEYVGTVAADNPWEFSHKAFNGQPGELMLIGRNYGFSLQDLTDLTAYAQTLPTGMSEEGAAPAEGSTTTDTGSADTTATVLEVTRDVVPTDLDGDTARGGRLYDKWWAELGVDVPEGDQALWATQSSNTRSGGDTWRCKECHGWDLKGVDGVYSAGSHKTGFTGLWDAIGKGSDYILGALKGETSPDHDFSQYMEEQDLIDLSVFLGTEALDDGVFVNAADKTAVSGNVASGEALWDTCADCHGPEGLAINFHAEDEPEYVPTIAQDNPWEFLSKMRYGNPGVDEMPFALDLGWTEGEQLDVLAYLQTLPTGNPAVQGGRMYDKWWKAIGVDVPAGDQPLWVTQGSNTRSGGDTWRCKECHGWDYKGADGVYASGSHATGFAGIWDAQSMSAEELTGWLDGTQNADHNFAQYMNEEQLSYLVAFIQEGLVDKSAFINADKTVVGGDAAHGEALFAECAECHGPDGKTIDFADGEEVEYVGTVASDNPWEFFNKASVGQPHEQMPSGLGLGWSQQDIIDVLTFAQTLPTK